MIDMKLKLISVLAFAMLAVACVAQQRTVAITVDDLPLALAGAPSGATPEQRLAETRKVNMAIIKALRKHHAPAIAFVNEQKVVADGKAEQSRAILREWIRYGNDLGNHTYSHPDLSKSSAEQFEKEVIDGEASVKPLMQQADKPLR